MIKYNWKIKECHCYNEAYGKTDVIFAVIIELTATNSLTNYSNTREFTFGIPYSDNDNYIAFVDITSDMLITWVKTYMSEDEQNRLQTLTKSNIDIVSIKQILGE
jgi:hypothetical protein